jgi:DUF971 family protein
MSPPTRIRALRQEGVFDLQWEAEPGYRISFYDVRCLCPCAGCVNEVTGERTLDPVSVPADVEPTGMETVGNYAVKILWSDGHSTGLYTWDNLHRIATSTGERL